MRRDRGAATLVVVAVVVVVAVCALGVARLGTHLVDCAAAQSAADAVALAGATAGADAAVEVARRNGAEVLAYRDTAGDVVVTVRVGDETATARARTGP